MKGHRTEEVFDNIAYKLEAVIYAMASKFLDNTEFNEIKEAVKMTELGTFIYNDGKLEGKKEDARDSFLNGADFELVKNSIKDLTEDVLREIYDEVMASKNND